MFRIDCDPEYSKNDCCMAYERLGNARVSVCSVFRVTAMGIAEPVVSDGRRAEPVLRDSRGAAALRLINRSEAKLQLEGFEESIQRLLRRVVPRINRAQYVRTRDGNLVREFFHADGPNDLAEGDLNRYPFLDCGQEKFTRELWISQILCEADVPILASFYHLLFPS